LEIDSSLNDLFSSKLGNNNIFYQECDEIRLRLIKNGTFKRCVLEAAHYEKLANSSIKKFENEKAKQLLFEASTSMMRLSKYITIMEDKYKVVLKPTIKEIKQRMKNLSL